MNRLYTAKSLLFVVGIYGTLLAVGCARYLVKNNSCDSVECSNHGTCVEENGVAICECENGYHAEGLECIENSTTSCQDRTDCDDHNLCTEDSCSDQNICQYTPTSDGSSCDDNDPCSTLDSCLSGICTSGITDKDSDNDGYLDAQCAGGNDCDDTNNAIHPDQTEGPVGDTTCNDQLDNDCDGSIDGNDTNCISCATNAECNDNNVCTTDSCLPSGTCENLAVSNGTNCDDDNACTQSDSCQSGICVGSDPISCSTTDECHSIGTCDPQTGICSNPLKADGTACPDTLFCNGEEICIAGVCSDQTDPCTAQQSCNESTDSCESAGTSATLSGGSQHTCAIDTSRALLCAGLNSNGQLGNDSINNSAIPVSVKNLSSGVSSVTTRYLHSCAISSTGQAYCWGSNSHGQLGNNSTIDSHIPVTVSGISDAVQISAGSYHVCAVREDQSVWCWGYAAQGRLGDGSSLGEKLLPVQVEGENGLLYLRNIVHVSCGENHSCAVDSSGKAYCWGFNANGQLGNGSNNQENNPVEVSGLTNVKRIEAGYASSCAITTNGNVYCWGMNSDGRIGDGTTNESNVPVQVVGENGIGVLENANYFSRIWRHVCISKTDGSAWCWGNNTHGALGDGTENNSSTPIHVPGTGGSGYLRNVKNVIAGSYYSCALLTDNTVWCWGYNGYGNFGNGSGSNSLYPTQSDF